MLFSLF